MNFIEPNWPAPSHVKAFTSTRVEGFSDLPYKNFNLAEHVGEDLSIVAKNRELLKQTLALPNEPIWLNQTHSAIALPASSENRNQEADATFSATPNQVCVILTADCLPILLCNQAGTQVAAIHAGWRGIARGIIENTITAMQKHQPQQSIMAWLGPAIGQTAYEVGDEVRQQFLTIQPDAELAFIPSPRGRWLASLNTLATLRLKKLGIQHIFGGEHCTFTNEKLFYSYRRDGENTGRLASLIWYTPL